MKLLDGPDDIGHVLDDVDRPDFVKRGIAKRIRIPVQIANHIGGAGKIAIDPNTTGELIPPTPDIQHHPAAILHVPPDSSIVNRNSSISNDLVPQHAEFLHRQLDHVSGWTHRSSSRPQPEPIVPDPITWPGQIVSSWERKLDHLFELPVHGRTRAMAPKLAIDACRHAQVVRIGNLVGG